MKTGFNETLDAPCMSMDLRESLWWFGVSRSVSPQDTAPQGGFFTRFSLYGVSHRHTSHPTAQSTESVLHWIGSELSTDQLWDSHAWCAGHPEQLKQGSCLPYCLTGRGSYRNWEQMIISWSIFFSGEFSAIFPPVSELGLINLKTPLSPICLLT